MTDFYFSPSNETYEVGTPWQYTAGRSLQSESNWSFINRTETDFELKTYENITRRRPALLKQTVPVTIVFCVAYLLVVILGVVSNSLVVAVIYRYPRMRTVTNLFLANLAVADIGVSIIVLPITLLSNLFTEWLFSGFLCKAIPYLQAVSVCASVNTLAAVAMERYFAIFHPSKNIMTWRVSGWVITMIWLVSMAIQVPWVIYTKERVFMSNITILTACLTDFGDEAIEKGFFLGGVFLTCYLLPLCFLTVCYSLIGVRVWGRNVSGIAGSKAEKNIQRSKKKIVKMLITVTVFFALSWLPLYSIRLRVLFGPKLHGLEKKIVVKIIIPIAQWMGAANSCVNPFVYCYYSSALRKNMCCLLQDLSCCITATHSASAQPSTQPTTR